MSRFRSLFVLSGTLLVFGVAGSGAPAAGQGLDAVLARLDQAAQGFKGLTADVRKISHTDVVNVDETDSGTITVKRVKPHDTRFRIDFTAPRQEIITIGGGKAQDFKPKSNEAQEIDLGKYRSLVDQFMLLGFGSNSAQLRDAYTMTLGGADSVNGETATRIVLVPKDPKVLEQFKKCELWISEKGLTVQQKVYTDGGDYLLSTYSKMVLNPNIPDSVFKLELPKGVKFGKLK